jgi:hypothetical protein
MLNQKAFNMIEGRFSDQVKRFNHFPVTGEDSDTQYWTVKERVDLARAALERAPEFPVTTLARSLGDIYQAVRKNLTADELKRWEETNEALEELLDKYEM